MDRSVDGVLLAAGRSSRAGVFKMAAELAGKPLLIWSLETMNAHCPRVIVVAGFAAEKVRGLAAGRPGVEVVVNENFAAGMLTSVQTGVRLIRTRRFFLLPGDMPLVKASVFRKLLGCGAEIAVPVWGGRRGHPVLLDSRLIPDLLAEPPASSLGRFIARRGFETVEVDDPGIVADLDDPGDLRRISARLDGGGKNE
jgi:molybdenum cofactor cytidylyltransferase